MKSLYVSLRTALHFACARGRVDIVRAVCEAGADPNITDNQGATPLHKVCVCVGVGGCVCVWGVCVCVCVCACGVCVCVGGCGCGVGGWDSSEVKGLYVFSLPLQCLLVMAIQ